MALNLTKGQRISLDKEAGKTLTKVIMGLGWDVAKSGGSIDLDASAVLFDAAGNHLDIIYFGDRKRPSDPVYHTGDNRTGAGDGDDEQIIIQLDKLAANVQHIVLTVNSYQGQKFTAVENAFVRLLDPSNNQPVCRYDLSCKGSHTALVMCRLYRHTSGWKLSALGETSNGRVVHDLLPEIKQKFLA